MALDILEKMSIIALELAGIRQQNITIYQAKNALANSNNYQTFRDELLQNFYWKADDYVQKPQPEEREQYPLLRFEVYRYLPVMLFLLF